MKGDTSLSATTETPPLKRDALDRLLRPRSIALVGATERSIWSVAANDNLRRFDYDGKVTTHLEAHNVYDYPKLSSVLCKYHYEIFT